MDEQTLERPGQGTPYPTELPSAFISGGFMTQPYSLVTAPFESFLVDTARCLFNISFSGALSNRILTKRDVYPLNTFPDSFIPH